MNAITIFGKKTNKCIWESQTPHVFRENPGFGEQKFKMLIVRLVGRSAPMPVALV